MSNPLQHLQDAGQSVWLDSIRRGMIDSGELQRMIDRDGLRGVTSNPAIFEKAISGSTDYRDALATLIGRGERDATTLYEQIAIADIQAAADVFRSVYEHTHRTDGYVSLEVSPRLARDTRGTCEEARRLWAAIDRPNVMIKVPGTPEGMPAIETLIGEGINVNVTLLFARDMYRQAAEAYLRGLERRADAGEPVDHVASVASFFVSRIDSAVEKAVWSRIEEGAFESEAERLKGLIGKVAVANAKLAYRMYGEMLADPRWQALAGRGARPQRLLWASTSTKSDELPEVYYVESLIGPETVNTVPPATYDAFREHGRVRPTLTEGAGEAESTLAELEAAGLSLDRITDRLLGEGVDKFSEAFDRLLDAVEEVLEETGAGPATGVELNLPDDLADPVREEIARWQQIQGGARIWGRDASLWTDRGEGRWLGWLGATEDHAETAGNLQTLTAPLRAGVNDVVLLGMGGSSLCPEVLARSFGAIDEAPRLHVLDSTDPAQLHAIESRIDLERCLFIVSSKSGSTLEPNLFLDYFHARLTKRLGEHEAGRRFVAITDPGSPLEQRASRLGFRHVFHGVPSIGGRYSALSSFGLVPAALIGVDVALLLDRAEGMAQACSGCVPAEDNPGVVLGAALGVAASRGRDKLTIVAAPPIAAFGAWLEQLLAESTGKQGRGIIPVDGEPVGEPGVYGADRLFVHLRLADEADPEQEAAVARLESAGHPVLRITLGDRYDLAREFFRWEFATAVAGAVLGVNPFDQPDVEASKKATRELTEQYEATGELPTGPVLLREAASPELTFYTDAHNAEAMSAAGRQNLNARQVLQTHLMRLRPGDYFATLAYVPMSPEYDRQLQSLRRSVRDRHRVATCLGYGPRFLHSTGQAYKGGPPTGVFLQIRLDHPRDVAVPGHGFGFGLVQDAQAQGDFQVLADRNRRVLSVHVAGDPATGLAHLRELIEQALDD